MNGIRMLHFKNFKNKFILYPNQSTNNSIHRNESLNEFIYNNTIKLNKYMYTVYKKMKLMKKKT